MSSNMDDLVKGVMMHEVAIPHYNRYLEKKGISSRDNRGYLHFHPSAFGDCIRKMALQYHSETNEKFKIEQPIDLKFMRICDAGHAFHYRMQQDMSIMGILRGLWRCRSCGKVKGKEDRLGTFLPDSCECQEKSDKRRGIKLFEYEEIFLKSEPEYNFKGNCDGVIEVVPGDETTRYIIDFKSMKSERFAFLRKPDEKHVVQVMIYMWLSGVDKAIIYYEDKNEHAVKEFIIPYNRKLVDKIKLNSKKLKVVVEAGKAPSIPKKYSKTKAPCRWCEYKDYCFSKR